MRRTRWGCSRSSSGPIGAAAAAPGRGTTTSRSTTSTSPASRSSSNGSAGPPPWAGGFVLPGRSCCGGATRVAARATLSAARSASASLAVTDVDVQRPAMTTISHARAFDAPAPPPAPAPAPVPAERLRWDAVQVTLAVLLGVQVWRVHELFPSLAIYGLPFAATVVALLVYWLDRDQRRRIGGLHQPVVRAAVGILALVALSVPGSLYPGLSLGFLLKDYLRSVILMLLVAGSVRGLVDLRRLAWIQLAGVTLLSAVILARAQMTSDGRLHNMDYYDVNDLATLIVCSLPLAVYLWRPARPAARLPLAAAIAFLMMTLGKTGSRGGFLGFLAVAAYLQLRWQAVSGAKRVGTVALVAVLLVAAFRTLSAVRRGPSNEATLVAQALTASLVGFVVTGMFLSQAYSANFYALLGMTIALARIASPRPVAVVPSVPPTHSAAVAYPLRRGVPPDDR